jgi:hypothetical protein
MVGCSESAMAPDRAQPPLLHYATRLQELKRTYGKILRFLDVTLGATWTKYFSIFFDFWHQSPDPRSDMAPRMLS